jgi:hypothetical protein
VCGARASYIRDIAPVRLVRLFVPASVEYSLVAFLAVIASKAKQSLWFRIKGLLRRPGEPVLLAMTVSVVLQDGRYLLK